ncbi:MAG: hypothetical protein HY884_09755 [Deltaproteobacteria bacterium]|nr:hypothetical protein [Deltaproteobacteria bacterium]
MAINWTELRRAYESTCVSVKTLSKRNKCAESTINKKARKEGWSKCKIGKKPGIPPEPPNAPCLVEVTDEHIRLWGKVKKRLVKGLRNTDVKTGLEELKAAKVAGEVLANVIKGERLAMGIPAPEPDSAPTSPIDTLDDENAIALEMAQVTAPPGADTPVDGE